MMDWINENGVSIESHLRFTDFWNSFIGIDFYKISRVKAEQVRGVGIYS